MTVLMRGYLTKFTQKTLLSFVRMAGQLAQ